MTATEPRPRIVTVAFLCWLAAAILLMLGGFLLVLSRAPVPVFYRGAGVLWVVAGALLSYLAGRSRNGDTRFRRAAVALSVALALLLLRSALSQMDVPTRTSYVMAVVTPPERPAAASVTAVPRSLASSISPAIAGVLLTTSFSGLPLVVCGALKIAYDLALLFSFRHIKPPEEQG